jgi:hypothetical protein
MCALAIVGPNCQFYIQSHEASIPVDSMPPTFGQAAAVTSSLGCRYLWIDSLGILQDNDDGWMEQAGKMLTSMETPSSQFLLLQLIILPRTYSVFDIGNISPRPIRLYYSAKR